MKAPPSKSIDTDVPIGRLRPPTVRRSSPTLAMRKSITTLAALLVTSVAMAAQAPYTCSPERGCQEEQGLTHDIGRGAMLSLPQGWTYYTYPMPPALEGLREVRAFRGGVLIVISPFPNIDRREISEVWIRDIRTKASAPYIETSKEKAVNYVSVSRDDLVGGYVSFTAENPDKPFTVVPNRVHANVTSFLISYKFVLFSISVASERSPDEDYAAAIAAIKSIR